MSVSVLVVDDEKFICEDLRLKLTRLDMPLEFTCDMCSSANQALLLSRQKAFDIVFTDIRMPFMSGIGLIQALRAQGFNGEIIVLSGYDDFQYVHDAFLSGADDYLLKPLSVVKLSGVLKGFAHTGHVQESCEDTEREKTRSVVEYACEYIYAHYADTDLNMADVAEHVAVSYSHFSMLFRRETGKTFPAYLLCVRIEKAKALLRDPSIRISEICYMVGFKYPQQFSRDFKKITGVYPSQFRLHPDGVPSSAEQIDSRKR